MMSGSRPKFFIKGHPHSIYEVSGDLIDILTYLQGLCMWVAYTYFTKSCTQKN